MAMQEEPTRLVAATVVGLGTDPDYFLAEDAVGQQFIVRRARFEGDWGALEAGAMAELVVTREALSRVLRARRLPRPAC